jgi:hypothetical protein
MATTTNFGWTTPDNTALVKDGASAIRTLGSSIDTSFVDLKGGTTNQVLAKASNTDLDFTWSSGGGKVVQIVTGTTTTGVTNSTSTYADTNLTATITPTSASNNILVLMNQNGCGKKTNNTSFLLRLMRGATQIALGTGIGGFTNNTNDNFFNNVSLSYLDSPATTSATTYKTQFASSGNNARADVNIDSSMSTIVLMEVTP